jgi:hypothetical protein
MSRTIARPGRTIPAALVAVAVLVVALAGSATAAKLITGKTIKNNTVTTQDIKNQSLTGADVKDGALSAADLAPNAKNQVRFDDASDHNIATCTDTALDACSPVAVTGLTPGTWLVTGSVTIDNFDGPATSLTDRCGLWRNGTLLAEARTPLAANGQPGEAASITLQQVVTAADSSTPVSLKCTEMGGENLRVGSPTITALKVS